MTNKCAKTYSVLMRKYNIRMANIIYQKAGKCKAGPLFCPVNDAAVYDGCED